MVRWTGNAANLLNLLGGVTLPTATVDKYVDIVQKTRLNVEKHRLPVFMPNF